MKLSIHDLTQNSEPLDSLVTHLEKDDVDISQDYQRGLVWTGEQKVNLIRSVLMGIPIGNLIVNDRHLARNYASVFGTAKGFSLIDGKQRLTALAEFMQDGFAVPGAWFDAADVNGDWDGVSDVLFSQFSPVMRRYVVNTTIGVSHCHLGSVEEERGLYLQVNTGGTAHTEEEMNQAR